MDRLNKKEAATLLGVSERTLNNYVQAGKISVVYIDGKFGKEAKFNVTEIQEFKNKKSEPIIKPIVSRVDNSQSALISKEPLKAIEDALQSLSIAPYKERNLLVTEIAVKPLLKLSEASILTGLGKDFLRIAIKSGELKAFKYGSWRINRIHLDEYISKLCESGVKQAGNE